LIPAQTPNPLVWWSANSSHLPSGEDVSLKEDLGVLFDQPYFQEDWTPIDIEKALYPFYRQWDSSAFHQYLNKFSLNPKQPCRAV
jgi:hypothetical protein